MSDDLRERFERAALPDAEDARRRAWTVVSGAAPDPASSPRRHRWRAPLAALVAAAGVGIAVTPPGAAVGEWVRARVAAPEPKPAPERATRLPAAGRLLVRDARGVAVVAHDGGRAALGRYDGATWSPRGLFVAAWRGTRLGALTPGGDVRWQITAPERIRAARWSPDPGFRVAYITAGDRLRVVAGDGTGDRPLAQAGGAIPAWRPGGAHVLAFVATTGRVQVRDVDTGALIARPRRAVPDARTLSWSPGGRLLAAMGTRAIRIFDVRRKRSRLIGPGPRSRFVAAVYAPNHPTLAVVTRSRGRSTVTAGREVFSTRGRIAGATWSADGRWLMLDAADARQLIAVRVRGTPRVLSFPGGRVEGWSR